MPKNKRFALGAVKPPRCPLCRKFMERLWIKERYFFVWKCDTLGSCQIAVRVDDPFVGHWDKAYHKATGGRGIICPKQGCETKVRYFATSTGYMKVFCPKCKTAMAATEVPEKKDEVGKERATPDSPGTLQ